MICSNSLGPKNLSCEWSGVFGDTVTGKNAFALSPWTISQERNAVLDTNVIFSWDNWLLAVNLKSSNDVKVFIRPFSSDSWLAIFSFLGFLLALWFYSMMANWSNETRRILEFVVFFFFLLIHSYYASALTGYFSTEPDLDFKNKEDVLKNIPDWTLIHLSGLSIFEKNAKEVSKTRLKLIQSPCPSQAFENSLSSQRNFSKPRQPEPARASLSQPETA